MKQVKRGACIKSQRFDARFERMEQTNELVHGSYNYHNVFLDADGSENAVTNFENVIMTVRLQICTSF